MKDLEPILNVKLESAMKDLLAFLSLMAPASSMLTVPHLSPILPRPVRMKALWAETLASRSLYLEMEAPKGHNAYLVAIISIMLRYTSGICYYRYSRSMGP